MTLEASDFGLAELLAIPDRGDVEEMKAALRAWYFANTRLERLETKLPPSPSAFSEHLAETELKAGFGGHLLDVGAARHHVEHFTAETVHSIEVRVLLPKEAASGSDGVQLARMILSNRKR